METLRLAAEGLTHAEMAGKLSISTNTVKAHLKAGYRKCGAKNRTELRRIIGDLGKDHPKN
jgi:LuxR family maltose regulon positive regulatory protein